MPGCSLKTPLTHRILLALGPQKSPVTGLGGCGLGSRQLSGCLGHTCQSGEPYNLGDKGGGKL